MADLSAKPLNLQNGSYTARQDRQFTDSIINGEGVIGPKDFFVTANGSNMQLSIGSGTASEYAFVRGDASFYQGLYEVSLDSTALVSVSAADPTNPRIDSVILQIYDSVDIGGVSNKATIEVLGGTATSGATLDNLAGATNTPSNAILLANILVPNGSTSVSQSNVRDRRTFPKFGSIPPNKDNTTIPVVAFIDPPGVISEWAAGSTSAAGLSVSDNGKQIAVMQYLPNRIVGANRIRFRYVQGTTAVAAGNYVIAIFDSSGRQVVSTGSQSFAGSAGSIQNLSIAITATTFEAGLYYVFLGTTGSTSSSFINFLGSNHKSAFAPNVVFHATTGGVTVPTTLLGMTASNSLDPATKLPYAPNVALSVG